MTADGIAIPFDSSNTIFFDGIFSSAYALFNPSQDTVSVPDRGSVSTCPGGTVVETPLPGGALLFFSGALSLLAPRLRGNARVKCRVNIAA